MGIMEIFKNHKANVMLNPEGVTLIKYNNGVNSHAAMTILLFENKVFVSGDLGEAIFVLTENANIFKIANYEESYLRGKMAAGERFDYDADVAVENIDYRIETFVSDYDPDEDKEQIAKIKSILQEFKQEARQCTSIRGLTSILEYDGIYDKLSDIDAEAFEWAYAVGQVTSPIVRYTKRAIVEAAKAVVEEEAEKG